MQKQPLQINFANGLDTKTDPKQVPVGRFVTLENSIFTKAGLLQKRNGFGRLPSLPDDSYTYSTTFNGNLTAIGSSLAALSDGSDTWIVKGSLEPAFVDTLPLIRSSTNQIQADTAIASNGLVCTVYTDSVPSGGSAVAVYKYAIADSVTGQNIVAPTVITASSGTITGSPRVFQLGNYFMVVFSNNVSGTYHLQYIAISVTSLVATTATDITTQYTPATTVAWDGVVANNNLYLAWNGSDGGGAIRMAFITSTLGQSNTVVFTTRVATIMSVVADLTTPTPNIYVSFYDSATSTGYTLVVDATLTTLLAPTQIIASGTILNITSVATLGSATVFYETSSQYSYTAVNSNFVSSRTITLAGVLGTAGVVARSVGLASKAFYVRSTIYFLAVYSSINQPTNFLLNGSGKVIAKLAYQNARGYYTLGLPSVDVDETTVGFAYFFKDLIVSVNKDITSTVATNTYTQTGINLAKITIGTDMVSTVEAANNLFLSGGFLWSYDGYYPVEQGFHLFPDDVILAGSTTGGSMSAQQYFYQALYEWCDNQGNIYRSAPSLPKTVTTTGATSSVTVNVPTLRLTYKTANPVKIVIYRYSVAQPVFYQVTSLTVPVMNSTTVDSIAFVDTQTDAQILGNSIIYTTGGVVENTGAPASSSLTLFKSRVVVLDAEDENVLWFSKTIVNGAPVEMSDLFTTYISSTTSAQGRAGTNRLITSMDDKLVIFKDNAMSYIVGDGPDNTGANNNFSEPVLITSTVGCNNQQSLVFIPQGLMFQSSKGIWLLGRDLSTQYIGAPVEAFNQYRIKSAVNIPGTNQVRFTLTNGVTLMYDYYYNQWGTFVGVPGVSSTIYEDLHTFINSYGQVYQELPGSYLDGSNPVLMKFTTGPINLAGVQGFQRAYGFFLAGEYISPHKLTLSISYDYSHNPEQVSVVTPENFNYPYGENGIYGTGNYGGNVSLEQWQVFFQRQKCQAFQITLQESFDSSYGVAAGAGFTLSSLNLEIGIKDSYPRLKTSLSVG